MRTIRLLIPLFILLTGCVKAEAMSLWETEVSIANEIAQLRSTEATLRHSTVPTDWDVAIYVSDDSFQSVLDNFVGYVGRLSDRKEVELTILEAKIDLGPATNRVTIEIGATDTALNMQAGFELNGILQYVGTNEAKDNSNVAKYRVKIVRIKAKTSWFGEIAGFLFGTKYETNPLVSALMAEGANSALKLFAEDKLNLDMPLSHSPSMKVGIKKDEETNEHAEIEIIDTDDGKGKIHVKLSMPESDIGPKFEARPPVFSTDGAWVFGLLASGADIAPLPTEVEEDPANQISQRNALRERVEELLTGLESPFSTGAAVWLGKNGFTEIIDNLNNLPKDSKKLTIEYQSHTGHLADELSGVFGYRLSLKNTLSGQASVSNARANWDSDGFRASVQLDANLSAKVRLALGIGLGIKLTKTLSLKSTISQFDIPYRLIVEQFNTNHGPVGVIGAAPICRIMPIQMEDSGDAKVSAVFSQPIGKDAGAPSLFIDSFPRYQAIPAVLNVENNRLIEGEKKWIERRVTLSELEISDEGYWFGIDMVFALTDEVKEPEILESELLVFKRSIEDSWKTKWKPQCPSAPGPVVRVAGHEIWADDSPLKRGLELAMESLQDQIDALGEQKETIELEIESWKDLVENPTPDNVGKILTDSAEKHLPKYQGGKVELPGGLPDIIIIPDPDEGIPGVTRFPKL